MPADVAESFENMVARLDVHAAEGMNKTVQWRITDAEPDVWAVRISDAAAQLIVGGVAHPDFTITTTSDTWLAISQGRLQPITAFMTGRLKVTGDISLAAQLPKLFPVG